MKQILLPLIGTMIFVILVGLFVSNPGKYIKNQSSKNEQKIIKIKDTEISVDVSDTSEKRSKGLSGRDSLNEKEGMFFVFDKNDEIPTFWMKDMIIPIDIIWINDGKIIQIDKNIQAPEKDTLDSKLVRYSPKESVDYVLEVNSGFSDKYAFSIGDRVDLSLIK
ncbi:MAG: DUF192 domain-containing protein [Patescibacteria group bacterium]